MWRVPNLRTDWKHTWFRTPFVFIVLVFPFVETTADRVSVRSLNPGSTSCWTGEAQFRHLKDAGTSAGIVGNRRARLRGWCQGKGQYLAEVAAKRRKGTRVGHLEDLSAAEGTFTHIPCGQILQHGAPRYWLSAWAACEITWGALKKYLFMPVVSPDRFTQTIPHYGYCSSNSLDDPSVQLGSGTRHPRMLEQKRNGTGSVFDETSLRTQVRWPFPGSPGLGRGPREEELAKGCRLKNI